jgi:hypothetical protein
MGADMTVRDWLGDLIKAVAFSAMSVVLSLAMVAVAVEFLPLYH